MLFPDLSLTLTQHRRAVVLDPGLMLSCFGLLLVRRLSEVMELWVPREFWHVLDNSQFYARQPEALFYTSDDERRVAMRQTLSRDEIVVGMKAWERIRLESHLGGLKLFWIGDGLSESLVPPGAGADLVWRYEALAGALDRRLAGSGPMVCGARDAVALAAALGSAFVLTYRTAEEARAGSAPALCEVFSPGVPCEAVAGDDALAAAEREHMQHLLVNCGAAGLLWSGLNLAVLHLAVPAAATLYVAPPPPSIDDALDVDAALPAAESTADPWEGAHAFWYPV